MAGKIKPAKCVFWLCFAASKRAINGQTTFLIDCEQVSVQSDYFHHLSARSSNNGKTEEDSQEGDVEITPTSFGNSFKACMAASTMMMTRCHIIDNDPL